MNILIIGSGGREDCLCWKVRQSTKVKALYCAPGNIGTARYAKNLAFDIQNVTHVVEEAKRLAIDLCIVGPEQPLSCGLVDALIAAGIKTFGPTKNGAELEASKAFAKEIMVAAGVPTASYSTVGIAELPSALENKKVPFVLKADGLAAGKGVVVCLSPDDVTEALKHLTEQVKAERVVIEEFLEGAEVSCIYACHDLVAVPLSTAHDYKRLADYDKGPNTGGMGTVSPSPRIGAELHEQVLKTVILPVLNEMKNRGVIFSGFLYAGLMLGAHGECRVLEFNTRLGDPETQVLLPRLENDLVEVLLALLSGEVPQLTFRKESAVCLVLASADYPAASSAGDVIEGIEFAEQRGALVFHAGTKLNDKKQLVTGGGRVLNIVGLGADVSEARTVAYRAADMVQFRGRQMRRDIGMN